MAKINTYRVYYSKTSSAKVRSRTAAGARKRAWELISGRLAYQYGWTKKDFLANASTVKIS